jgi:hypothetical protein
MPVVAQRTKRQCTIGAILYRIKYTRKRTLSEKSGTVIRIIYGEFGEFMGNFGEFVVCYVVCLVLK